MWRTCTVGGPSIWHQVGCIQLLLLFRRKGASVIRRIGAVQERDGVPAALAQHGGGHQQPDQERLPAGAGSRAQCSPDGALGTRQHPPPFSTHHALTTLKTDS